MVLPSRCPLPSTVLFLQYRQPQDCPPTRPPGHPPLELLPLRIHRFERKLCGLLAQRERRERPPLLLLHVAQAGRSWAPVQPPVHEHCPAMPGEPASKPEDHIQALQAPLPPGPQPPTCTAAQHGTAHLHGLQDLELDGQAVAVPARHEARLAPPQQLVPAQQRPACLAQIGAAQHVTH